MTNTNQLKEIIEKLIEKGYSELTKHPEKYKQYEASNGWGTVEDTIGFFRSIIKAWGWFCKDYPELVGVATFWIE